MRDWFNRQLNNVGDFITRAAGPIGDFIDFNISAGLAALNAVAPGVGVAAQAAISFFVPDGLGSLATRAIGNAAQRGADALVREAREIADRGADALVGNISNLFSGDVNSLNVCVNDIIAGGGRALNKCIDTFSTQGAGALNTCFNNLVPGGTETIRRCVDNLNQKGGNVVPESLYVEPQVGGIISAIDSLLPGGIANIFNLGLGIGAILALGAMLYAGILYSISGDNASQQKEARAWMWAVAKGLALLAFGVVLINIINPSLREIEEVEMNQAPFVEVNDQFNPPEPERETEGEAERETILTDRKVLHQVPLIKQGAEPWGSIPYGHCRNADSSGLSTFAQSGCVPASLAMVIRYFTDYNPTPQDIGNIIVGRLLRSCGSGTFPRAITAIARGHYNLVVRSTNSWNEEVSCLRQGGLVIARMRAVTTEEREALRETPRDRTPIFTTIGHYIVVTGADLDRRTVFINDPGPRNVQTSDMSHYVKFRRESWCINK